MRDELTMAELNRIFYGAPPVVEVTFFDKQVTDVQASRESGHRVLKTVPYVKLVCHRENVRTERPVQEMDIKRYKAEWQQFMQEKEHAESDAGHRQVPDVQPFRAGGTG